MILRNTSPFFQETYDRLSEIKRAGNTLYTDQITNCVSQLDTALSSTEECLRTLQISERLLAIHIAHLGNNVDVYNAFASEQYPLLVDQPPLEADISLQENLAAQIFNIDTQKNNKGASLKIGDHSIIIAKSLFNKTEKTKVPFYIIFEDYAFQQLLYSLATDECIRSLGSHECQRRLRTNTVMAAIPSAHADLNFATNKDASKITTDALKDATQELLSGKSHFTLTKYPTPTDAERDNINYPDYLRLFFEMCDQPWKEIKKAHLILIEKFNTASHARFLNKWGTDLAMSLVEANGKPFTFCNSLVDKNVPGSEIFSAPERHSTEGLIVSRGRFAPKTAPNDIITNLKIEFNRGQVTQSSADNGHEHFERYLDRHQNNRYVGEIGIGTNPALMRHITNSMLVEKIARSFHIALGASYTMTDYMGQPVHINNGNESPDHWDITTLLNEEANGEMQLDGKPILKNGRYLDPRLAVLNEGWNAVPMQSRPKYWQRKVIPLS